MVKNVVIFKVLKFCKLNLKEFPILQNYKFVEETDPKVRVLR